MNPNMFDGLVAVTPIDRKGFVIRSIMGMSDNSAKLIALYLVAGESHAHDANGNDTLAPFMAECERLAEKTTSTVLSGLYDRLEEM